MAPKLKLVYFNLQGRGELLRLLLHAAGVDFTDERVDFANWPELKPTTPEGTLPYLDIGGKKFGEAMPLARYIAKKHKLYGKNELQELAIDIILNQVDSIRNQFVRFKMDKILTDEQKKELESKFLSEEMPKFLTKLETALGASKQGFIVGDHLSAADIAVLDLFEKPLQEMPGMLENYPQLQEHRKKVQAVPKIAKYLAARPETQF